MVPNVETSTPGGSRRRWLQRGALALVCATVVLYLLGYTWQLVPLVLAGGVLALASLPRLARVWRRLGVVLASLGAIVTALACGVFPVPKLPQPTGPYRSGVAYLTVPTALPDTFTPDTTDTRQLHVKVWYPAERPSATANPFVDGGRAGHSLLAELAGLPSFVFWHFGRVQTHSTVDAPMRQGQHPLVVFSHGYGSWLGQNVTTCETLASHGFIVVAVGHSHFTQFAPTSPTTLVRYPRVVPLENTDPATEEANYQAFLKIFEVADGAEYTRRLADDIRASLSINAYASLWASDIQAVLNACLGQHTTPGTLLYDRIDTQRIGAFGMSFGGAASNEAALHDRRIKAAANLDGTQYGQWLVTADTLRIPTLFLEAKRSAHGYSMYEPFRELTTAPFHALLFDGARHYSFTDVGHYTPLVSWIGLVGTVDRRAAIEEMNAQVLRFFTTSLSGKPYTPTPTVLGAAMTVAKPARVP